MDTAANLCTTPTTINGKAITLQHAPCASALDVIREQAGLTGTKLACGAGVCGACTILVNKQSVTACMMPATALAKADVRTVEHHDANGLHPVQKAFLAHDGLQCGFCTPGFINEAIHYYEHWQQQHGKGQSPSREAIAQAMSGHLCRCGAYVGIHEAVRSACAGEFDDVDTVSYPRLEGMEKVTGSAKYTVDVHHDGMLTAKLLGSPHAHAKVVSIDTSAAEAIDGVKGIIDILDDPHRVVRYVGHSILAIAATSEDIAMEAMEAVVIDYDVQDFVIDALEATKPGSAVVYPESKKKTPNASEGPIPPGKWRGNVRTPLLNKAMSKKKRKAIQAIESAPQRNEPLTCVSHTFVTPAQTHTSLEPHGCVAHWETATKLTVHTGSQSVYVLANEICDHYKLKREDVAVYSEHIGGAFGSKQGLRQEITATIDLAKKTNAPVKLIFDRLEEMTLGGYRPETRVELSLATDGQHQQRGMQCLAWGNCGIAVQSQLAPWVRYTYHGPKHCADFDVTTNAGPAKPMRGPGGPPAFWALESGIDALAHQLDVDPVSLRRKWDDSNVREALYDWAESIPEWRNRHRAGSSSGRFKSGMGLAIGNWFNAYHNATRIKLSTGKDGLMAECAVQDMGQGSRSVIGKTVADELGISAHDIQLDVGRSDYVEGPISSASRSTASLYPTSIEVAQMLKSQLLESCDKHLNLKNPRWGEGGVKHDSGHLSMTDLLQALPPITVTSSKRGGNGPLDILGHMPSGDIGLSMLFRMTGALSLVSVEVDTRLGRVHPQKVWMGMSVGKITNPELATSQVYGAVVQSLGFTLTEERRYDPLTGSLLSIGLEDYRIPGIGDIPEIDVHFHEEGFEMMRGGACGLSEIATLPMPPALGNAVFNATGWRPTELPLTPRRLVGNV